MGFFKALDTIVHGGIQQPESYERKKNYTFLEVLGKQGIWTKMTVLPNIFM